MVESAQPTRLLHISDLHLGKSLHGFPLIEEQEDMLGQILSIIDKVHPDGLIIAGDVYDKSVPREDAVTMFSYFLAEVESRGCPVYMIGGNHDSGRRLDFGDVILKKRNIHIAGAFKGDMDRIVVHDGFGDLNIYMLPYIKPSLVRPYFDEEIGSPDEAMRLILDRTKVDSGARNLLVSHQFYLNSDVLPKQCESETSRACVGGLDCISASFLDSFDYVALGHIHTAQKVGRETVRYCGTPLKYSLSEVNDNKSVTIVSIYEKNHVEIDCIPIVPLRDVAKVKGTMKSIREQMAERPELKDMYVGVVLTEHVFEPEKQLRLLFDRILSIEFEVDNKRSDSGEMTIDIINNKTPQALFEEFYSKYTGRDLTVYQRETIDDIISGEGGRL